MKRKREPTAHEGCLSKEIAQDNGTVTIENICENCRMSSGGSINFKSEKHEYIEDFALNSDLDTFFSDQLDVQSTCSSISSTNASLPSDNNSSQLLPTDHSPLSPVGDCEFNDSVSDLGNLLNKILDLDCDKESASITSKRLRQSSALTAPLNDDSQNKNTMKSILLKDTLEMHANKSNIGASMLNDPVPINSDAVLDTVLDELLDFESELLRFNPDSTNLMES